MKKFSLDLKLNTNFCSNRRWDEKDLYLKSSALATHLYIKQTYIYSNQLWVRLVTLSNGSQILYLVSQDFYLFFHLVNHSLRLIF